jgi:hypothetical protein
LRRPAAIDVVTTIAFEIHCLQKPKAQLFVNLVEAPDDLLGERGVKEHGEFRVVRVV